MSNQADILKEVSWWVRNIIGSGSSHPLVKVRSTIDHREYKVRDLPDKQKAADMLAKLRMRLMKLMDALSQDFPNKPQIQRLKKNFSPDPERFLESTPDADHTSYSINKGEEVHMCLRQKDAGEQLVNENVLVFVAIHEMAHMITQSIGHEPEFWNNFGWLLREAEQRGLYSPMDFKMHPATYCGVMITDSPRYDPNKDEEGASNHMIGKMQTRS